jgi:hypothetical protein
MYSNAKHCSVLFEGAELTHWPDEDPFGSGIHFMVCPFRLNPTARIKIKVQTFFIFFRSIKFMINKK